MPLFAAPPREVFSDLDAGTEPSVNTTLDGHIRLVQQTGLNPPEPWQAVKRELDVFSAALNGQVFTDRLISAITEGTGGDTLSLMSGAFTKADPYKVEVVHAAVHAKLLEHWQPFARRAYMTLAGAFDAAARRFAHTCAAVDVEAAAESILGLRVTADAAAEWRAAPELAGALDVLLPKLAAAAELLRGAAPARIGASDAPMLIPLCVEVTPKLHRRRLWEAWCCLSPEEPPSAFLSIEASNRPRQHPIEPRCGRWGALQGLGAHIYANPDPVDMRLFLPPRPFIRQVADPNTGRRMTPVVIDPEDALVERGPLKKLVDAITGPSHSIAEEVL